MTHTALGYTAIHEAGHAVIATICRLAVARVSIVPDQDSLGQVLYASASGDLEMLSSYPGPLSEHDWVSAGRWEAMAELRQKKVERRMRRRLLSLLAGPLAEEKAIRKNGRLKQEADWDRAVDIAFKLSGNAESVESLLAEAEKRAQTLLSHKTVWNDVRHVSKYLLKSKAISGRKLRQILSESIPTYSRYRTLISL